MKRYYLIAIGILASINANAQGWSGTALPSNALRTVDGLGNIAPIPLGIGVATPQSLIHATNATNRATFRFSEGLTNETPSLMAMNPNSQRAISITAGTTGTVLYYSNNTNLDFASENFNTFNNNLLGNGSVWMTLTNQGNLGIGTRTPSTQLHTTGGVRFQGILQNDALTRVMVQDNNGNVSWRNATTLGTGNTTNTCNTINFVPKLSGLNTYTCSQIFDDGTSVGIGSTGPFGFTPGALLTLGTPPPPATFRLSVNGWTSSTAFVALSDRRLKKDIKPIENALEKISKLNGVTYNWNRDFDKSIETNEGRQIGFLAQDLEKVIPEATVINEKGIYGVTYDMIIPVLTEAIKEQQAQIEELKKLVAQNSNKNSTSTSIGETSKSVDGYLMQNTPNPFSNNTEIKYQLPKATQSALLGIYDLNGKQVKMYPINTENNSGSITVQANDLQAGMYLYTLVVDGKAFDTKRMVLTAQ